MTDLLVKSDRILKYQFFVKMFAEDGTIRERFENRRMDREKY